MLLFIRFVVLCTTLYFCRADLCRNGITVNDLPEGVVPEVVSLFTRGVISDFEGCPSDVEVDSDNIRFWHWNNTNPVTPVLLNGTNPLVLNNNQSLILLLHGWLCNITSERIPEMRDAYLQRYQDINIVAVEWTTYGTVLYTKSFCYLPKIAPIVGDFLCSLGINMSQVHIVGHSLGAQLAGLTAQETLSRCNDQIGRITGLDPAGPLYQNISTSRRLDASDAAIVDVIHSSQGQAGYYGPCGTADFYPNCGFIQPGCLSYPTDDDIDGLINTTLAVIFCNHIRSADYFVESILSDGFRGVSCRTCPGIPPLGQCVADLLSPSTAIMGEDYPSSPGNATSYYLTTNSEPPFAED